MVGGKDQIVEPWEAQRSHDEGVAAENAGDTEAALRLFRTAVDASIRANDVGRVFHNRFHVGSLLARQERYLEALAALGPVLEERDLTAVDSAMLTGILGSVMIYVSIAIAMPVTLVHIREALVFISYIYRVSSMETIDGVTEQHMVNVLTCKLQIVREDWANALVIARELQRESREFGSAIAKAYIAMNRLDDAEAIVAGVARDGDPLTRTNSAGSATE